MKIILFGSTGMLGNYINKFLSNYYEIYCITRNIFDIKNDNWNKLENILQNKCSKNDIIINCAGVIPQNYNINDYHTFIKINSIFPHKLNEISKNIKCKFIHITTDCVFSGTKGNYTPTDTHDSKHIYGVTKSLGEPSDYATIIRTSIIGEELLNKKSLLEWVISNKNNTINGYINHIWNGVTCLSLTKFIYYIIENNILWIGIKHIFSPEAVTKFDLCNYINQIYELNININVIEDIKSKNMTLLDIPIYEFKSIYQQIEEQKEFNKN